MSNFVRRLLCLATICFTCTSTFGAGSVDRQRIFVNALELFDEGYHLRFTLINFLRALEDGSFLFLRNDDHSVFAGYDDVARFDLDAGAIDFDVFGDAGPAVDA